MVIKIGVLTLSDRASAGVYADESGIAIQNILKEWIIGEINFTYRVIPDEYDLITANLIQMCE